jgi:tetratricopeptide (TPR) repeat protein
MPPTEVQWQPALVVLVSGLVLGALLVGWLRRRGGPAATAAQQAPSLELRDLDGRVATLLLQLRELDEMAAKRTPEQLARERYALELAAAHALQEREALTPAVSAPAAVTAPAAGGAARGFVWGVSSAAALGLLLLFVWQSAEQRQDGGSVTGTTPGAGSGGSASGAPGGPPSPGGPEDARTVELRAALARNPEDHGLRLDLARHLLIQRDLMGVWTETQHVLEHEPAEPRALSYQALVRLAMGQGDLAVSMLQQAIAAAPDLLEARQNLAFVYASLGRTQEAEAAVAEVARLSPEEGERVRQALVQLAEARRREPAAATAPAGEDPHAGLAPPTGEDPHAGPAAPAAVAQAEREAASPASAATKGGASTSVFGWIEADASVAARVRPGTVVFLTVREAGVAQGPPVAVKRLESGVFPLQFELGGADSMMGQPLPARMRIDVRADSDGDPMTRPATDAAGFADGVELGRTGVRIALK